MKKRAYIITFMILISTAVFAQNAIVDSLRKSIKPTNNDTTNISLWLELAKYTYLQNTDTTMICVENALAISNHQNNNYRLNECYGWLGYLYEQKGNISMALEYNFKSLSQFEVQMKDLLSKDSTYNGPIKQGMASVINNIGVLYYSQKDYEKALEYHLKSLHYSPSKGGGTKEEYLVMAATYSNIAAIYKSLGNKENTYKYNLKGLKLREENGDELGVAVSLIHIGGVLCDMDSVQKGMTKLKESLNISNRLGNKQWSSYASDLLGIWFFNLNLLDSAEKYGDYALTTSRELGYPLNIQRAADLLQKVYRKHSKWKEALSMYELHIQMRDSINNENTQKSSIRQQTKYEFEKAQLIQQQVATEKLRIKNEAVGRRDNLQYSIILIALLVVFGGVLSLGFIKVSPNVAEGLIFFSFLILFEFVLVLADPTVDKWSEGAPGYKLLFNALLAGMIFPLHAFFERILKLKLIKHNRE